MVETGTELATLAQGMPQRLGGRRCLDFANTVNPRGGPSPFQSPHGVEAKRRDYLADYRDLIAWAVATGLLTPSQGGEIVRSAAGDTSGAQAVFERAITLREAIYRIFWTIARRRSTSPDDLAVVRDEYRRTLGTAALRDDGEAYHWEWVPNTDVLDCVLWPVASSAVDVLTRDELRRVKICPGAGGPIPCAWLFYDESKNRARHWCSMEGGCGKTVKARRQNARRRGGAVGAAR